jgi:hypothetical protein
VAANVNMPSDFPRLHRSASPDRAEVLMVVLVTMLPASIGTVILRWHRRRAASSNRTPHE